jgi:signal transduction histidine kinase/DNA-binding NarL/FixJ family response regulator
VFSCSSLHGAASEWLNPQRGLPVLQNHSLPATRHNGEVWAFASDEQGRLWVGSDELYLFNGVDRERISLPTDTYAVRAFVRDEAGDLWVASIGEIGRLRRTRVGDFEYISSRAQLEQAGLGNLGNIWMAHRTAQGLVFLGDNLVIRFGREGVEHWSMPSFSLLQGNSDGNRLWIFQNDVGLFEMGAKGPELRFRVEELPEPIVFWAYVLPSTAGSAEELLVGGIDGIYRGNAGHWRKLQNLSALVSGKLPWRALMLDGETLAVGNYLGGLVIGTVSDHPLAIVDRFTGLPSNTITGIYHDGRNTLWVGYPGGFARVDASGSTSLFDGRNGLVDAPALKVISHEGESYVLSRGGLSRIVEGGGGGLASLFPASRISLPLSDVISDRGRLLLAGSGGGVWSLGGAGDAMLWPAGGYLFGMQREAPDRESILLMEGTHLRELQTGESPWRSRVLSDEMGSYPVSMVRGTGEEWWVSTATRGVFRFRMEAQGSRDRRLVLVRNYRKGSGLGSGVERPILCNLGDAIHVLSEQGILVYQPDADSFAPIPGLENLGALAGTGTDDPTVGYWIVKPLADTLESNGSPTLLRVHRERGEGMIHSTPLEAPGLALAGHINRLGFTASESGTLWAAGNQSLVRIALGSLDRPPTPPALSLSHVWINGAKLSLPEAGAALSLGADTRQLRIELAGGRYADGHVFLVQTALSGLSDDWSKARDSRSFEFTGLRPGAYEFHARNVDALGQAGPVVHLSFEIAAPWYERPWAALLYLCVLALLVLAAMRWRLRRLRMQNEKLNRLVEKRTGELVRANSARNEFLETISHEIRNPLNGITNLVDLLGDSKLNADEQKLARSLRRSAEHLKRVFGDVLDYTKLEYGHVSVERRPFSLRLMLDDLLALFDPQAREQHVGLSLSCSEPYPECFLGDADKLRTILDNFVSNALKYAPGSPVRIEVLPQPPGEGTRAWNMEIRVHDQGPGLSEEEQAGLFRKFARGQRARDSGVGGTGLGLSICKNLAELMDGCVGVSSRPGEGTRFWLRLPLEEADAAVLAAPQETRLLPGSKGRVLIVDDQDYNQAVLQGIARRLGYLADVAAHPEQVWPLVAAQSYQVVFLDWELPTMNGGEIARRLRQNPCTQKAIILATTAHDGDEIRQQCLEAGMDGFAVKPFDTSEIRRLLSTVEAKPWRLGADLSSSLARSRDQTELTFEAFADFAQDDASRIGTAVDVYLRILGEHLVNLRRAVEERDREATAREAHLLRSHAGLVNGRDLNQSALLLGKAARDPANDSWFALLDAVRDQATKLEEAIIALRKDRSGGA